MKDTSRIIAALLIGAAAGAALGLLLAPEKGETLREGISDHINDLVDSAKDAMMSTANDIKRYGTSMFGKGKSALEDSVNELHDKGGSLVENARAKGRELKDHAKTKFDEGKAHVKNGSADANEAVQKA